MCISLAFFSLLCYLTSCIVDKIVGINELRLPPFNKVIYVYKCFSF